MKAIIFDMDGVIIDSEPLHFKIEKELIRELGVEITNEEHNSFVGTTEYHMFSIIKEKYQIEFPIEEMIEKKKEMFIENLDQVPLVENFKAFLLTMHKAGYPMALASSNNKRVIGAVAEKFDLKDYIKVFVSADDVKRGKPDPEIFLTAAEKLGIPPASCLVIEDARNGVKAAKAAGMRCIGLQNLNSGNQDLSEADLVIGNFNELNLDIIKGLFK